VIDTKNLAGRSRVRARVRQDAALRQKGLEQKNQEGWQGRPIALRRGQVHPERPPGHVSVPRAWHTVNFRAEVCLIARVPRRGRGRSSAEVESSERLSSPDAR